MSDTEYMTDGAHVVTAKFDGCVGAARCHPDDVFDFETGRKLAKARAMEKKAQLLLSHAKSLRRIAYDQINHREKA